MLDQFHSEEDCKKKPDTQTSENANNTRNSTKGGLSFDMYLNNLIISRKKRTKKCVGAKKGREKRARKKSAKKEREKRARKKSAKKEREKRARSATIKSSRAR